MIRLELYQATTNNLTNNVTEINLPDPYPEILKQRKNKNILYLYGKDQSQVVMPEPKTLNATGIYPLALDCEKSSSENRLMYDHLVYDVGKVNPANHVRFLLKDENSRDYSKYYFLKYNNARNKGKYVLYGNEFYESKLSGNKNFFNTYYLTIPVVLLSVFSKKEQCAIYSMHVENSFVKIKQYAITLHGINLTIKRNVLHILHFNDEKKWKIDQELKEVIEAGVYKRILSQRSIEKYYKELCG